MKKQWLLALLVFPFFYAQAKDPCTHKGWQNAKVTRIEAGDEYGLVLDIKHNGKKQSVWASCGESCYGFTTAITSENYSAPLNQLVKVKLGRTEKCAPSDMECMETGNAVCFIKDLKVLSTPQKPGSNTSNVRIEKQKYGIKVTNCTFDFDGEKFCTDNRLKKYAQVLKSRKANFDRDKILFIFDSNDRGMTQFQKVLRAVVIEKKTGIVSTFDYALLPTDVAVNSKGEPMEFIFNAQSNKFCFKGRIEAYQNSAYYDPEYAPEFCFVYDNKTKVLDRVWERT